MIPTSADETITPATGWRWSSAVWLAVLGAVLALHVWFPHVDAGPLNDTYNVDVGGRNAFYQYAKRLQSRGALVAADRNHESLASLLDGYGPDTTLCLLGPARYPTPREWKSLLEWVRSGGKLLVAARWEEAELTVPEVNVHVKSTKPKVEVDLFGSGRLRKGKHEKSADDSAEKVEKTEKNAEQDRGGESKPDSSKPVRPGGPLWTSLLADANFTWKTDGVIEAPGTEVLVKTGESPQAVRLYHGRGTIVLLATDYIFSNAALYERERHNGLLAVKLLQAAGTSDKILFDESLNATGTPRVVGVLFDPALRPATVQLLVILVVFGWQGSRRFGSLLPVAAPARHDVADHTNSLGNLYYKAHHSKGVLREYLEQLRTELRLRFSRGHAERALRPIADRARMSVEEVQRLLAAAEASAGRPRLTRREAAFFIRRLAQLRQAAGSRS
jgi:hypothetical protein